MPHGIVPGRRPVARRVLQVPQSKASRHLDIATTMLVVNSQGLERLVGHV